MAGIWCDEGISVLNAMLAQAMAAGGVEMHLFQNNVTPATSDTLATYTESTFPGYAPQPLVFLVDSGVVGNIDTCHFVGLTFTRSAGSGSEMLYGYFLVDPVSGDLLGAQLLPVPILMSVPGQAVLVNPAITYQDRSIP
jgi:hypothetical protein